MSAFFSMAAFALAASISPGPVNIVALGAGAQHGFTASLRHVTGATLGFTTLLVLTGFGLRELLIQWPEISQAIQWAGVAFLLFMAWKLALDSGEIGGNSSNGRRPPSMVLGALMQWLNPKAWLAAIAGMGVYAAGGSASQVLVFASIYFVICYASIAAWAWAGSHLRHHLHDAIRVRLVNRLLAALLVGCAVYMLDV